MWISSLKRGKNSKLTLVFSLLYRAAGWETPHRHTTFSNLLHVSSKAAVPGSSLLYFSSLLLLMKLQVYCGYTAALVNMCPEITVEQWEVCGSSDAALKYSQQPHGPKSIIIVPSQPREAFHHQVG